MDVEAGPIAPDPLRHLLERGRAVGRPEDVPREPRRQGREVGPRPATDDPASVPRVELEEERLSRREADRLARSRLPEVDLVERPLGRQEVVPVAVGEADPEPHEASVWATMAVYHQATVPTRQGDVMASRGEQRTGAGTEVRRFVGSVVGGCDREVTGRVARIITTGVAAKPPRRDVEHARGVLGAACEALRAAGCQAMILFTPGWLRPGRARGGSGLGHPDGRRARRTSIVSPTKP